MGLGRQRRTEAAAPEPRAKAGRRGKTAAA
jgi:hypothetical protein